MMVSLNPLSWTLRYFAGESGADNFNGTAARRGLGLMAEASSITVMSAAVRCTILNCRNCHSCKKHRYENFKKKH